MTEISARAWIEHPQYRITLGSTLVSGEGLVRIDDISDEAILHIFPHADVFSEDSTPQQSPGFLGEWVTDYVINTKLYPEGTVLLHTNGGNDLDQVVDGALQRQLNVPSVTEK